MHTHAQQFQILFKLSSQLNSSNRSNFFVFDSKFQQVVPTTITMEQKVMEENSQLVHHNQTQQPTSLTFNKTNENDEKNDRSMSPETVRVSDYCQRIINEMGTTLNDSNALNSVTGVLPPKIETLYQTALSNHAVARADYLKSYTLDPTKNTQVKNKSLFFDIGDCHGFLFGFSHNANDLRIGQKLILAVRQRSPNIVQCVTTQPPIQVVCNF